MQGKARVFKHGCVVAACDMLAIPMETSPDYNTASKSVIMLERSLESARAKMRKLGREAAELREGGVRAADGRLAEIADEVHQERQMIERYTSQLQESRRLLTLHADELQALINQQPAAFHPGALPALHGRGMYVAGRPAVNATSVFFNASTSDADLWAAMDAFHQHSHLSDGNVHVFHAAAFADPLLGERAAAAERLLRAREARGPVRAVRIVNPGETIEGSGNMTLGLSKEMLDHLRERAPSMAGHGLSPIGQTALKNIEEHLNQIARMREENAELRRGGNHAARLQIISRNEKDIEWKGFLVRMLWDQLNAEDRAIVRESVQPNTHILNEILYKP
jgi:hypothetical protein